MKTEQEEELLIDMCIKTGLNAHDLLFMFRAYKKLLYTAQFEEELIKRLQK